MKPKTAPTAKEMLKARRAKYGHGACKNPRANCPCRACFEARWVGSRDWVKH